MSRRNPCEVVRSTAASTRRAAGGHRSRHSTEALPEGTRRSARGGSRQADQGPMSDVSIKQLLQRPGVYQLYLHDDFVYVGREGPANATSTDGITSAPGAVSTSTGHRRLAAQPPGPCSGRSCSLAEPSRILPLHERPSHRVDQRCRAGVVRTPNDVVHRVPQRQHRAPNRRRRVTLLGRCGRKRLARSSGCSRWAACTRR